MTQVSDMGQDEAWGWPCPYCRAHNPVDSERCANCGSQLRDAEGDDLFTTVAADNAEVVPPEAPFARDNMWTTDANDPSADQVGDVVESELVEEPPPADDLWDEAPGAAPGPLGGFSAEPTDRYADVIDEPFTTVQDLQGPTVNGSGGPLFGSRSNGAVAAEHGTPIGAPSAQGTFGTPAAAPSSHHVHVGPSAGVGSAFRSDPSVDPTGAAPVAGPSVPLPPSWSPPPQPPVPDAHGLAASVGRLRPDAAEVAAVPISVAGALLYRDEVVLATVTGQMLGHPAVVVLTNRRVLVVNGRRWQPIVDSFDLGPELLVRGRHDRDIASLTFSDGDQLSTVDAITEVALAVELAERIRGD